MFSFVDLCYVLLLYGILTIDIESLRQLHVFALGASLKIVLHKRRVLTFISEQGTYVRWSRYLYI